MSSLDPEARALLDELAELGVPSFHHLTVEGARKLHTELFHHGEADEPVGSVRDYLVPGPAGDLEVRVYRPTGDGPFPVTVFAHGGGWILGDLENHDLCCRLLAERAGCIVVSVDYRLAPEHPFPAAVEDVHAAVEWVVDNAGVIHGDPGRLAVAGDSAGGNLAAAVALADRDLGDGVLDHQLLIYPATDHSFDTDSYRENAEGYFLTRADMEYFWDHYLESEVDGAHPYASPLRARDLSGLPPATVVTAGFDPLRDDGRAYADRLDAAGVPVDPLEYEGMIHGFWHLQEELDRAGDAMDDVAERLRSALSG